MGYFKRKVEYANLHEAEGIEETDFFFNDMFSLSILKQKPVRGNGHVKERITEGLSHQVLLYIN